MSDLPSDWITQPLGDGCQVQGGFAFKSGDYTKNGKGVPIIKIGDIQNGRVIVSERSTRVPDVFLENKSLEKFLLRNGDILIAMTGATTGKIGKYDSDASGNAYLNQRVGRFLVDNESLVQEFIQFLTQTDVFQQRIQENILAAAQGNISPKKLESIPVTSPPLPEQKKIAHILSTVQRAIEAQARIIQTTTELKKALMHKLFTEGLRNEPQKQTEIGPVPESWEVVELGEVAKVGNGSTPKRANEAYWEGGTIPWLNSTKIHDRFITEADQFVTPQAVKECHLPKVAPNSLLIAITGQGKTLGNSAITRIETCINQHLAYVLFHSPRIVPDFVLWFMQTRYDYLRSIAHGGGSTKGALTCGFLKTLPIPVPSTDEQQEIVSVFQTLEDKEGSAVSKKSALQDLFRTLLYDLMTAKMRVHRVAIK